jgi:hypothetical protein
MPKRFAVIAAAAALTACQSVGGLTVKDYTAKSGERVVAGQAAPRAEYNCQKVGDERQDWGLAGGVNTVAATERVTAAAVEHAPGKGANYAYVNTPASIGLGSVNVNAFADARVEYYRCANLPPAK